MSGAQAKWKKPSRAGRRLSIAYCGGARLLRKKPGESSAIYLDSSTFFSMVPFCQRGIRGACLKRILAPSSGARHRTLADFPRANLEIWDAENSVAQAGGIVLQTARRAMKWDKLVLGPRGGAEFSQ